MIFSYADSGPRDSAQASLSSQGATAQPILEKSGALLARAQLLALPSGFRPMTELVSCVGSGRGQLSRAELSRTSSILSCHCP